MSGVPATIPWCRRERHPDPAPARHRAGIHRSGADELVQDPQSERPAAHAVQPVDVAAIGSPGPVNLSAAPNSCAIGSPDYAARKAFDVRYHGERRRRLRKRPAVPKRMRRRQGQAPDTQRSWMTDARSFSSPCGTTPSELVSAVEAGVWRQATVVSSSKRMILGLQSLDRRGRSSRLTERVPNRICGLVESQRSVCPEEGAYQIGLTRRVGFGEEPLKVRPRRIAADAQLVGEPLDGLAVQHRHRHPSLGSREPEQSLEVPGGGDGGSVPDR